MKEKQIEENKPDLFFRYHDATLISIGSAGTASTITFLIKEGDRTREKWCFYDESKFDSALRTAIKGDQHLNLLIGRYIIKVDSGTQIEDRLEEVWFIHRG